MLQFSREGQESEDEAEQPMRSLPRTSVWVAAEIGEWGVAVFVCFTRTEQTNAEGFEPEVLLSDMIYHVRCWCIYEIINHSIVVILYHMIIQVVTNHTI